MAKSAKSSSWTALRNHGFRAIWLASVISGICASAHGTAATWAINQLSHSTLLLSLMSTFSSLPFFLFTLPAGAFADMMDRAKLVRIMHVWLAASAAGLAILGWLHLLNGNLVLLFVFLIGADFAFNAPAFSSLLTDIVSDEELPSASVLSGLQLDIAGDDRAGSWRSADTFDRHKYHFCSKCRLFSPYQSSSEAMSTAKGTTALGHGKFLSIVCDGRPLCALCARDAGYFGATGIVLLRVAAIPALLPVIGLKELHVDAAELGLLYTSMGAGSVITVAFILPWARARYSPNTLTRLATYLLALVILMMAFVRQTQLLLVVAAFAAVAWCCTGNELWVAGQRAMPGWARGRMNATVLMFSQGAMALGGVIYGTAAQTFGVTAVLVAVAGFNLVLLLTFRLLSSPLSIDFTQRLSFEPGAVTPWSQNFVYVPQPRDGPVLITIDFQVDEPRGREIDSFISELGLIHLRNGAYSWQLIADPAQSNHFHVQIMMPSWSQYLLHFERITKAEKEVIDRAISLHIGEDPPETRMYIRVNKTFREEEWKN